MLREFYKKILFFKMADSYFFFFFAHVELIVTRIFSIRVQRLLFFFSVTSDGLTVVKFNGAEKGIQVFSFKSRIQKVFFKVNSKCFLSRGQMINLIAKFTNAEKGIRFRVF